MSIESEPIIGNWYQDLDKGDKLEVVALDKDNGAVEIQYSEGDLDKIDLDAWYAMSLESIESPDDWTGPMDVSDQDDAGYSELALGHGQTARAEIRGGCRKHGRMKQTPKSEPGGRKTKICRSR